MMHYIPNTQHEKIQEPTCHCNGMYWACNYMPLHALHALHAGQDANGGQACARAGLV